MQATNMKRFLIILSVVAVLLAAIATIAIVLRSRSNRQVPAAPDPGARRIEAGTNTPPVSGAAETPVPNGIVPREKDAPPELSEAARKDADNDGLIDGEEALLRTDPNRKDTDGDGLGDADGKRRSVGKARLFSGLSLF